MSHFFTVVIVPKDTQDVKAEVARLLAPYDENIEVEPYQEKCWCVGMKAREEARKAAERQFGPFEWLRESFQRKVDRMCAEAGITPPPKGASADELSAYWEKREEIERQANWKAHIKHWTDYEDAIYENHPLKNSPDPNCDDCGGTGQRTTTYNPKAKWDWWRIGGRWNGEIKGTPQNSRDGFNFGAAYESLESNCAPVRELMEREVIPFAVVTPDGEWHERGEMGWWAIVTNEKDDVCWTDIVMDIYRKYPDHLAVGCDLHI